jgi:hypothetical protein
MRFNMIERCSEARPGSGRLDSFRAEQLARKPQALAALGPAAEALIGFPFATDPCPREIADLGFPKGIAQTDNHGRRHLRSGIACCCDSYAILRPAASGLQ